MEQSMGIDPVSAIAGSIGSIFTGVSNLIITSPSRIGKSTVRPIVNNLNLDNDNLLEYYKGLNNSIDYKQAYEVRSASNNNITFITIAVIVVIGILIYKKI